MDFINSCFNQADLQDIGSPTTITEERTPKQIAGDYFETARELLPLVSEELQKVCAIINYLSVSKITGYKLLKNDQLTLFCIMEGESHRTHGGKLYIYKNGLWTQIEQLHLESQIILTAVEGFFVKLSEVAELQWKWEEIQTQLQNIQNDGVFEIEELTEAAKQAGDFLKKTTKNQVYNGNWQSRVSDMIQELKRSFDKKSTADLLTNEFRKKCSTEQPRSRGIQFQDIYLDENYTPAPRHPNNDCYFGVNYPLNVEEIPREIEEFLKSFLKSYYFNNHEMLLIKLAQMRCAIEMIPNSKIIWEIGDGGVGKSEMYNLESNVLGKQNSTVLDPAILYDRNEFRKSAHFGVDKTYIRFQEINSSQKINSDVWKKAVSGESMDARQNYGKTNKISFKNAMKSQEANLQSIPVIEFASESEDYCGSIYRRIIAARIGNSNLVLQKDEVNHEQGKFLKLPQQYMEKMIDDPRTSALFMRNFYLPFVRQFDKQYAIDIMMNPGVLSQRIENDTKQLAMQLSGKKPTLDTWVIQHSDALQFSARKCTEHLIEINKEMGCAHKVLKQYRVGRSQVLKHLIVPHEASRCCRTNAQKFAYLIDNSDCKLYRPVNNGVEYEVLNIDANDFFSCYEKNGGSEVFGELCDWGDTFQLKKELKRFEKPEVQTTDPQGEIIPTCVLLEKIDIAALRTYAAKNTDKRQAQLEGFIQQFEEHETGLVERQASYQKKIIDKVNNVVYHRQHSSNGGLQQLSSIARKEATKGHAVDIDFNNCHPNLIIKLLKDLGLSEEDLDQDFKILKKYCKHYLRWRDFVAQYLKLEMTEAKRRLITFVYGGTNHDDVPFLVKLSHEIKKAVELLLAQQNRSNFLAVFSKKNNPCFSALAYMLFEVEDQCLQIVLNRLQEEAQSRPIVLMFDGAIVSCQHHYQKQMIIQVLVRVCQNIGLTMKISDWGGEEKMLAWRLLERGLANLEDEPKPQYFGTQGSFEWAQAIFNGNDVTVKQWQKSEHTTLLNAQVNEIIICERSNIHCAMKLQDSNVVIYHPDIPYAVTSNVYNTEIVFQELWESIDVYVEQQ